MRGLQLVVKHALNQRLTQQLSSQTYHTTASTVPGTTLPPPILDETEHDHTTSFRDVVQSFKPRPLTRKTCTRILTIQPSSLKSEIVTLKVEEIDLASTYEPFVAISHVWGSKPKYDTFVMCDGRPRRTTGRVESLLRRIRNKAAEGGQFQGWTRIWIDTLCIDQRDEASALREKNQQVSMMHKIFGDAQEVVVDLGAADRYSAHLPSMKADIVSLRQKAFDDEYCKDILGFPSSVKVEADEALRVRNALEACSRLLDKQWMCRIWAVQEYALARKCRFFLGNTLVDGSLLDELGRLAAEASVRGRSHLLMLFSRFRRALALAKLPRLDCIRDSEEVTNIKKLSFAESLALGWHHDCTDERDTVYALRALVDYRGPPLAVDYNEPSHKLAKRVSCKLVEIGDYEAVLAGASGLTAHTASEQPSWMFLMRPPFKFVGEERHWILSGKPNRFKAGGQSTSGSPPLTLCAENTECLEGSVSFIGTIESVTDKFPRIPQYGSNPKLPVERVYTYNTERTIHTRAVIVDTWLRYIIPNLNRYRKTVKHLDRRSIDLWRTITHGHNAIENDRAETNATHRHEQQQIDYWLMLVDMSLKGLQDLGYHSRRQPQHRSSGKPAFSTKQLPSSASSLSSEIRSLEEVMRKRHLLMADLIRKPQEHIDQIHHEFDLLGDPRKKGVARLLSKAKAIAEQNTQAVSPGRLLRGHGHEQVLKQVALNTYLVNEAFDIRQVRTLDQLKMLERRIGVLQDGRLVSAPHTAEAGDIVVIFRGISVPYILRKDEDKSKRQCYKIVGMAYVDNIMHGEAEDEGTVWEKIRII